MSIQLNVQCKHIMHELFTDAWIKLPTLTEYNYENKFTQ